MAEWVRLLTNRGKTVENEANPNPNPKKPPSITFTIEIEWEILTLFELMLGSGLPRLGNSPALKCTIMYHGFNLAMRMQLTKG